MHIPAFFAFRSFSAAALGPLALALGACAANGPRYHEVMAVAEPQEERTRIFVLRDAERWFDYRSNPAVVHLNGERIGRLLWDGFFYVDAAPGPMSLAVSTRSSLYGACALALEAGPGETVFLNVRVRGAYLVAGGAGAIIGGELAGAAVSGPMAPIGSAVAKEVAASTIGTEIGAAAGSAVESRGKKCGGPFVITVITEEQAMERLDGLAWSE